MLKKKRIKLTTGEQFESVTGKGVCGRISGRQVALGNAKLMEAQNIDITSLKKQADELCLEGQTVMFVAVDGKLADLSVSPIPSMRNIRQNLFFAFIYNALGTPVAARVLYPFFDILLSPMFTAVAMSFSSASVITNALRLRKLSL